MLTGLTYLFSNLTFRRNQLYNLNPIIIRKFCTTLLSYKYKSTNFHCTRESSTMPQLNAFKIDDYDIIGFDLDNTLLQYNLKEMIPLEYKNIVNILVDKKGYSKELLKPIGNDMDFIQRGLILDVDRGNVLKISPNGSILKASHGTKFLSDDEIVKIYGPDRNWTITSSFAADPLSTWNGPLSERMRTLLDYFDMPACLAFARAVDEIDTKTNSPIEHYNVYSDILAAMTEMFKRESFSEGTSEYFEELKSNPKRYILPTELKVINWLKQLKENKTTFLLTGSHIDFVNLTATHSLGEEWKSLFDVVICYSKKPGFFTDNRPFFNIENLKETTVISANDLKLNNTYSQGNWKQFREFLMQKNNIKEPRCLYIGDNFIQDIYTPAKYNNITTICIAEEMNSEKENIFGDVIKSHAWDSYFYVKDQPTIWTSILQKYAKICLPKVDYLTKNEIDDQYVCSNIKNFDFMTTNC